MKEQATAAKHLLPFIQDYFARNRAMPSFAEVGKLVGLSVSTVHFHVNTLKEHGFLGATDTGRLIPGKAFFQRQLVSTVRAGLPAYADDSAPEGVLIDQLLIDTPSRTFLLTVKGESMKDAGLMPGDCVVVKRGALVSVGDIVVVDANGEGTVKELAQHSNGELYLRARNAEYPDIAPAEGFEIVGVVVGQFRRYTRAKAVPLSLAAAGLLIPGSGSGSDGSFRGTSGTASEPSKSHQQRRTALKVASPLRSFHD
jgi:SOS regulatory protein LexA